MKKIIPILCLVLYAFLLWYFMLPPINLSSPLFWLYIFLISIVVIATLSIGKLVEMSKYPNIQIGRNAWQLKVFGAMAIILLIIIIVDFVNAPIFNASKYAARITVDETTSFVEDVKPVDLTKIPLLDKASSQKLGDRIMGQATEWVSQFYVSELYTQINYNEEIIRVTPIEYAGLIKYFSNRSEGIKGYITVNSVNGEAKLKTIEKGMHYMPSAYFFENLNRKLRLSYPTLIFDDANFEIDNEGNPYWIVPTVKYVGVGLRKEITGVVILDAVTGESKKYAVGEVPEWVDHVYSAELVIDQMNNWGEYKQGFFNSIFGQKNVVNTTEGYNYLVMDNDVYLYTGITSVSTDESNLGFVLINLRTKETHYYSAPGAEEFSAMASAEGLVQEKGYDASFPLLVNLNNKPTYLLSLKDNAGLVKMYALVDVADYQKVIVSDSSLGIEAAVSKYLSDTETTMDTTKTEEKNITISNITTANIDGNTYYYIVDTDGNRYQASIKVNKTELPFLKKGDNIKIVYTPNKVNQAVTIEVK